MHVKRSCCKYWNDWRRWEHLDGLYTCLNMAAKEDGLWFHFMLSEKGESQVASALTTTTKKKRDGNI